MNDTIDGKIYELFNVLEAKKTDIKKTEKLINKSWITTGSIAFPNKNPINIQTASEDMIKQIVAELLMHKHFTNLAEETLNLEKSTTFGQYSYSSWITDCEKRLAKLSLTEKNKSLADLEKRLNSIVSPDQRRQMELEAITKELSN